jgi:predicted TIM-barrel fold metal-dependent hydrolase
MNNAVMSDKNIDIHIHVVGTGDSGSGCVMSREFASGASYAAMLDSLDILSSEASDLMIEELLLEAVNSSEKVERCVLLAMDGVYKNSRLVGAETHLMTPNDYVARIARENGRILFGASVHPYRDRKEMLNEMERCLSAGAVLFFWAPCVQRLDPEDDRCIPFYIRLAKEGVPLLCQTGNGFFAAPIDAKTARNGSPKKLVKALDIGVKVIAAHCAPAAVAAMMPANQHFDELITMLKVSDERRWQFFVDISCFFAPEGLFYLERLMKEFDRGNIKADRLIYGSDFPVSIAPGEVLFSVFTERLSSRAKRNPLDKRHAIAKNLGVPDSVFTNAWSVLRPLSH